ncbi:MAG: hypothetical protein ACXADC_10955 [Candidatus Thorarchaeota archaeon]|jgi:hypothetical protein
MSQTSNDLTPSGASKFEQAKKRLIPNEEVRFVIQIEPGFFVVSDRRGLFLRERKGQDYNISRVIPLDCLLGIESEKSDRVRVTGITLDKYGCHEFESKTGSIKYTTYALEVKAPRVEKGENKDDVRGQFQSAMSQCHDIVKEIRDAEEFTCDPPPVRDYSYLENMPESLTRNAILDLNTISEDWPVHDELHQKSLKFLGSGPFLLEESLRSADEIENGILFAAGEQGYIWIQGKKNGRYMANVLVDRVEWDNIRCFVQQWQNENAAIAATYAIHRDGVELTMLYHWSPTPNEDVLQYPWLLQPLNGPWIIADVMYKYAGKPMPASWVSDRHQKEPEIHKQRYYF